METSSADPLGGGPEMPADECMEDSMAPDCFPWPQDDTPDAKPEETLSAMDIHLDKISQPLPPNPKP